MRLLVLVLNTLCTEWERVRDLTLHQSLAVFVPVAAALVRLSYNSKFGAKTSLLDRRYLCFVSVDRRTVTKTN